MNSLTPHTPSFPVENDSDELRELDRRTEEVFRKVLPEVPQETISNHTSGGTTGSWSEFHPHNFRLYFKYSRECGSFAQGSVRGRFVSLGSANYGKEFVWRDEVTESRITVKRKQTEVRYKIVDWYRIHNANSRDEMLRIYEEKVVAAVELFREFVRIFGGEADLVPVKVYPLFYDSKLKNAISGKVPAQLLFETAVVKKLYREKELEYKTPDAAIRAAHNAGVVEVVPEIVAELKELRGLVEVRIDPVAALLGELRKRVRLGKVWSEELIGEPLRGVVEGLSLQERLRLSEELFSLSLGQQ